jgi:hypothetical protein
MLTLGIDIDGTIKQTQRAAVQVYNEELGKNVKLEDVKEFHLDKSYGISPKEGAKLWRKLEHRIYKLAVPLENASEVLRTLSQEGHRVVYITARPGFPHIRQVTVDWLKKYRFPFEEGCLHMNSQDKASVAIREEVDLFFEDAPNHLDRLVEAGIPTVIVDAVYNRDYPVALPRIHSWDEGLDLVRRFDEQMEAES